MFSSIMAEMAFYEVIRALEAIAFRRRANPESLPVNLSTALLRTLIADTSDPPLSNCVAILNRSPAGFWKGSNWGTRSSSARWCPIRTLRRTPGGGTASRPPALRQALSTLSTASWIPFRATVRAVLRKGTAR